MVDASMLAMSSRLRPGNLKRWSVAVGEGLGFSRFTIQQKGRRPRVVLQPDVELNRVLKQLRGGLTRMGGYIPPPEVHGFIRGRGIASNAAQHLSKNVVLRIDLRDFFGSISGARVRSALEDVGFDGACAALVSKVCVVEDGLAQGFSTSPLVSNMAFLESDRVMIGRANATGASYTRYVDDLIFSGDRDTINDVFLADITGALEELGWKLNSNKTRFMRRGKAQFVTGLSVADRDGPHIPRTMKRILRREVHFALKYGISDARFRSPTPMRIERLGGWIHYAAHVDPKFGEPLREQWKIAAPSNGEWGEGEWLNMIESLDFPENW